MKFSEHFTLDELTVSMTAARHGIDNKPDGSILENLHRLAARLEDIRTMLGRPVIIMSGYRTPALNAMVGGQPNSQHCFGCAADIRVAGVTPDSMMKALVNSGLPYDQLIREFDSWVHYSIPNQRNLPWRMQALIIDRTGTRPYPVEEAKDGEKTVLSRFFGQK